MKLAFLGLGLMGSRQAARILAAGYPLNLWNRTLEKAQALAGPRANVCETARDAVKDVDIIFIMLENGAAVSAVLKDVAPFISRGATVVDMSSIHPSEAKAHAEMLAGLGVHHVDAPVSGGPVGAEAGNLAIMAGGDEHVISKILPLFRTMGNLTHVGPHGAGQTAKLANQVIVGVTIIGVAEALTLAARGGADPIKVREALQGGFADSRVLELHGMRMVERDFTTKSRSVTQLKDLRNAISAAREYGMENISLIGMAAEMYESLINNFGDVDHSGVILEIEKKNKI